MSDYQEEDLMMKTKFGRERTMKSHKSPPDAGFDADVVVIGSGGGLAAAVAAAEKGAKVSCS